MRYPGLIAAVIVAAAVLSAGAASAGIRGDMDAGLPLVEVLENALGEGPAPGEVEAAVRQMVEGGAFAGEVVMAALMAGYDAGAVISGAVKGGGELMGIISSAVVNGGLGVDEAARICVDCGADPAAVADAATEAAAHLEAIGVIPPEQSGETPGGDEGAPDEYGYSPDEGGVYGSPPAGSIPSGGGGGGGADISPSS